MSADDLLDVGVWRDAREHLACRAGIDEGVVLRQEHAKRLSPRTERGGAVDAEKIPCELAVRGRWPAAARATTPTRPVWP